MARKQKFRKNALFRVSREGSPIGVMYVWVASAYGMFVSSIQIASAQMAHNRGIINQWEGYYRSKVWWSTQAYLASTMNDHADSFFSINESAGHEVGFLAGRLGNIIDSTVEEEAVFGDRVRQEPQEAVLRKLAFDEKAAEALGATYKRTGELARKYLSVGLDGSVDGSDLPEANNTIAKKICDAYGDEMSDLEKASEMLEGRRFSSEFQNVFQEAYQEARKFALLNILEEYHSADNAAMKLQLAVFHALAMMAGVNITIK